MFCKYCGKELDEHAAFCPNCGAKNDTVGETAARATVNETAAANHSLRPMTRAKRINSV